MEDKKYITDLYNHLGGEQALGGTIDKFESKVQDPKYAQELFNHLGGEESLGGGYDKFYDRLKKKEQSVPMAPTSGSGSNAFQGTESFTPDFQALRDEPIRKPATTTGSGNVTIDELLAMPEVTSKETKKLANQFEQPINEPDGTGTQKPVIFKAGKKFQDLEKKGFISEIEDLTGEGMLAEQDPALQKESRRLAREYAEKAFLTPEQREDAAIYRSMIKSGVDPKNPTPRFQEILNERYAVIDEQIAKIEQDKQDPRFGRSQRGIEQADAEIKKLQKRKEFFFGTPDEKLAKAIESTGNVPTKGDKYSQLTKIVEDKTYELRKLQGDKEMDYKDSPFKEALMYSLYAVGASSDKKRDLIKKLKDQLKDLVPMILTAKDPEIEEDGFASSFVNAITPKLQSKQATAQERAINVLNAVNQLGLKLDKKDQEILTNTATETSFQSESGGALGTSLIAAGELLVGNKALGAAKVFRLSAKAISHISGGKKALELARKSKIVKEALKSGIQYETAGTIFQDEQLDFASGLAGGVGMGLFQKAAKPLLSMIPQDVKSSFLVETGKKLANIGGAGTGGTIEELSQLGGSYIKQAVKDGSFDKIGEYIHKDFKSMSDLGRFAAITFTLEAAGGIATNPNDKIDFDAIPEKDAKTLNEYARNQMELDELNDLTSLNMEGFEGVYNNLVDAKKDGIITQEFFDKYKDDLKVIATANERIRQDLDLKDKAKAQVLMLEKMSLEDEVKGVDKAMVQDKLEKIDRIDEALSQLVNPTQESDQVVEANEMVKQPTTKEQYAGKTTAEVTQMAMNPSESTAQDTVQEQEVVAQETPNILEEVKTLFPEDLNQEVTVDDYSKLSEKLTQLGVDPNEYIPVNAKPQTFKEVEEAISDKIAFTDEIQSLENKLRETDLQDKSAFDGLIESLDNTIKKTTAFSQKYAGSNLGFITTPINGFLVVLRETLILARKLGKTYDEAKKLAYDRFTGKEEGFEADKEYLKLSDEDRAAFDKTVSELKPTPPKDPEVYKRMIVRNIKKDKAPVLNYIKKSLEGVRISGVQLQEISEGLDTIALNSKEDAEKDMASIDKYISDIKEKYKKDRSEFIDRTKEQGIREYKKDRKPILDYVKKSLDKEKIAITPTQFSQIYAGIDSVVTGDEATFEQDMKGIDGYLSDIIAANRESMKAFNDRLKERAGKEAIKKLKKDRKFLADYVDAVLKNENTYVSPGQMKSIMNGIESAINNPSNDFTSDIVKFSEQLNKIIETNKAQKQQFIDNIRISTAIKTTRWLLKDIGQVTRFVDEFLSKNGLDDLSSKYRKQLYNILKDIDKGNIVALNKADEMLQSVYNDDQRAKFYENRSKLRSMIRKGVFVPNSQSEYKKQVNKIAETVIKDQTDKFEPNEKSEAYLNKLKEIAVKVDVDYKKYVKDLAKMVTKDQSNEFTSKYNELVSQLVNKKTFDPKVIDALYNDVKDLQAELKDPSVFKFKDKKSIKEFIENISEKIENVKNINNYEDLKKYNRLNSENSYTKLKERLGLAKERLLELQRESADDLNNYFSDNKEFLDTQDKIKRTKEELLKLRETEVKEDPKSIYVSENSKKIKELEDKLEKYTKKIKEFTVSSEDVDEAFQQIELIENKLRAGIENVDYVQDEFEKRRFVEAKVLLNSLDRNLFTKEELESIKPLFEVQRGAIAKMNALEAEDFFLAAEQVANGAINKHVYDTAIVVGSMQNEINLDRLFSKIKPKLESKEAIKWIDDLKEALQLSNLQAFDSLLGVSKELDRPFVELSKRLLQNAAKQEVETNRVLGVVYDTYNKLSGRNEVIKKISGSAGNTLFQSGKVLKMFRTQVGMIMTQARYNANPVLMEDGSMVEYKDLPEEMKDKFRYLYENSTKRDEANESLKTLGTSLDEYQEAWEGLIKDEKGNIDLQANIDLLNSNKETKAFIEAVKNAFANTVEKARVVAHSKGHDFNAEGDSYFAFNTLTDPLRISKESYTDGNIFELLTNNIMPTLTTPGAAQAISRGVFFTEMDVLRVVSNHVQDVNQYYYISNPLKSILSSFKRSSRNLEKEMLGKKGKERTDIESKKKMNNMLAERMVEHANFQYAKVAKVKDWVDKVAKSIRVYALSNPFRLPADFAGNSIKAMAQFNSSFEAEYFNKEYAQLLEDTGSPLMLKYDRNRETINSANQTRMEKIANDMVTWADVPTARFFFINAFRENYKKLTGLDFDIEEYALNKRNGSGFKYKEAIQKASDYAGFATSEVMNSQDSFSQATHTRLIPFVGKVISRDTKSAKSFNLMQSYSINDTAQLMIKSKDLIYGTNEGRIHASKRILGILASNVTYGVTSNFIPALIAEMLKSDADDDEKNDFIKAAMETRENTAGIMLGSIVSLATGRYATFYKIIAPGLLTAYTLWQENLVSDTKDLMKYDRISEEQGNEIIRNSKLRQGIVSSSVFEGLRASSLLKANNDISYIKMAQAIPLVSTQASAVFTSYEEWMSFVEARRKQKIADISGGDLNQTDANKIIMAKKEAVYQSIFTINMLSTFLFPTPVQGSIKTVLASMKKQIPSKELTSAKMEYDKRKMTLQEIENYKDLLKKYKDTKVLNAGYLRQEINALRKKQSIFYKENELDQLFDASFLDE